MAIEKPSLNNFLPNGFETQDKDGYKVNFDSDKIATGFDKDTLEILSGPNLNNLLDKTGKNFNILEQFLTFFRDMPIGSFPITNASNQLDYKSVNSFFRNVGELVFSAIPLEDGNLRLLDGSLLEYTMTYSRFITYIAGLRASLPNLFCTQAEFDQSLATYGVCGKFVYDTVTKSLRLPKISGFIKGTLDSGSLGDVDEAKAPQHSHTATTASNGAHKHDRGTMEITGSASFYSGLNGASGAFQFTSHGGNAGSGAPASGDFNFKASRTWSGETSQNGAHTHNVTVGDANNSVFKAGNVNEPQAIKEFIYIVVSIDEAEKQVLSAVYNYKGSVPTYADLPTAVAIGEVYNVIGEDPEGYSGANFAWTGEEWDRLGGTVNLSGYLTKTEAQNTYATKASLESNVDYLQGQINTNASNIANIASQEVIDAGIQKIQMLKFASTLGIGKVTDTDLFEVIKKYKYSSFCGYQASNVSPIDTNKFIKIGSPSISKDGILSNCSQNNALNIPVTLSQLSGKSWTIEGSAKLGTGAIVLAKLSSYLDNDYHYAGSIYWNTNNNFIGVWLRTGDTSESSDQDIRIRTSDNSFNINDEVFYKLSFDINTGVYSFYCDTVDGSTFINSWTATTANKELYYITTKPDNYLSLGAGSDNNGYLTTGSINLKRYKVIIDGVEVFNGRKEGMDILKADDFTLAGTPTISADGIASGFSLNDYLKPNSSVVLSNSIGYEIDICFTTPSTYDHSQVVCAGTYNDFIHLQDNQRLTLHGGLFAGNRNTDILNFPLGKKAYFKFINNTSTVTIKYRLEDEVSYTTVATNPIQLDLPDFVLSSLFFGRYTSSASGGFLWAGSIDLNEFKIYINGELVYQPLLRIPYTISNTGLKITDKLDRAISMSEWCGFSQYFGFDEDNLLCLIPQGDNITGRRDLISRVEDSTTHYVTEIYSDLYCRQMGSGTATTAVTLDIPFKDGNYKLSVPQSAKSKTGFTPTASCDWTAEGYIYLDEVI